MQTFATVRGDAVAVPIRRRALPITPAQARARRHAHWLHAHEVGTYDPATNRIRRHSAAELASLWDVSKQTILNGLASARQVRALVLGVAAGE